MKSLRRVLANRRKILGAAGVLGLYGLMPGAARAVDIVLFSSSDAGSTHAVSTWTDDFGDLRVSGATMGSSLASYGTDFDMSQALNADGTLSAAAKAHIDGEAATIRASGLNLSVFMGPTVGNTDSSYLNATYGNVKVDQWAKAITAYKNYWQASGFTVTGATPFNEPDYWSGQGSAAQLAQVMQLLRDDPGWKGIQLQGGTTLNAANAQAWYTPLIGVTDAGSSHLLGGSLSNYDTFAQSVVAGGVPFAAPELHSLGEAIVSANYNATQAGWWATAQLARGTFSQESSGKRLGYSVNFNSQTAAAIYRGPDGSTYAFAGGMERMGTADTYRFVSTDRSVYVNGIGPINSYTLHADSDVNADAVSGNNQASLFGQYADQGAMARIDYGTASMPALDGYRWEIQNVQTGQYLSVAGGATGNNALINTATGTGSAAQMWDITRLQDGYLTLINDNSGRVLAVSGATQNVGGSFIQYDSVSSLDQQLSLAPTGNGTFYIQDGNSAYYLTGSSVNCTQQPLATGTAAASQQWRFVSVNPTRAAKASYAFNGNANDTTGVYNAAVTGTATYTTGPTAGSQALVFNGTSTYLTLPAAVSNTSTGIITNYSSGFTVDTWVKWNGGNAWQRIFDFGTGTNAYMFLTPSSGDGTMRFGITSAGNGNGNEEDVDATALQTGQWVNVAVTLGGRSAIIYVNGKPAAAGSVLINPTYINATNDYIGKSQFAADPLFNGSISQFSVYDYALTPTQIADLLNNNLTWTGNQNGNTWDAATTANFKLVNTGVSSTYHQGDRVTFDGTGTGTVNLSGALSPFSVTVNSSVNTTFGGTGSIAGSTALNKTGLGTLTINTSNTFTGGTTISGGTVVMANAAALGTGGIDLVTGGTLTTTNFSGGTPILINTIYGDGGTLAAAASTTLTLAGNLAGSGSVLLSTASDGSAILKLTGDNSTFAGNAVVNGTNIRLASATAGSASATWTVNTTLQLDVTGAMTYQLGALAGSGVVAGHAVNATSVTSILVVGGAGANTVFSGQISDNASGGVNNIVGVTVAGTGTQVLSGNNTYTGPTLISSGTLMLGNGGTTGSISLASALTDNGTLGFNRSNSLTEGVDFNAITGSGGLLQAGTGTLLLEGTNSYSGGTTILAGVVSISDDVNIGANGSAIALNGGTLATTASVFDTHPITVGLNGGTINVQTAGQYFFNINNLLRGDGALTVTGNGTLTQGVGNLRLAQGNSFNGAVVLQQGGILEYGQNGAISSSAAITIANQGELAVQGGFAVTEPSAITVIGSTNSVLSFENGTAGNVSGAIMINGNLTVGLRDWYNYNAVRSGVISGVISGGGSLSVNSGAGTGGVLTLSGANTFTGNITVGNATVAAAFGANDLTTGGRAFGALGNEQTTGRTVTINSGGTVSFTTGNVLGSGGSSVAQGPNLAFVVNAGGTLLTASADASGGGGGDANILGKITVNGGTITTGNGYNTIYQSVILLGTVTIGGTTPSTINTNATNTTANGVMLAPSAGTAFNVARTGTTAVDLMVTAPLVDAAGGSVGSFIKSGAGIMQLSAANSYTGTSTVSAGSLVLTGSLASTNITVAAGANFNASGSTNGGLPTAANLTVNGKLLLAGSPTVNGPAPLTVNSISVGPAGIASVADPGATNHRNRTLLVTNSLTFSGAGQLDLASNDLDVTNAGAAGLVTIANEIRSGYAGGTWNGSGISSSTAAGSPAHLTALGVILNNNTYGTAAGSLGSFDTLNPGANDVLVKYTYYGDSNLDGKTDGTDYSRIDTGFLTHATGWFNGDFNYDGVINGSDYTLIDNAFNTQGSQLAIEIAAPTADVAGGFDGSSVPEPMALGLLGIGAVGLLGRRRSYLAAGFPKGENHQTNRC